MPKYLPERIAFHCPFRLGNGELVYNSPIIPDAVKKRIEAERDI
jgi:hypothetical protein